MSELLLELFSEEIPAIMQPKAAIAYEEIFSKYFTNNGIKFGKINVYVGPRRLTIHASDVSTKLPSGIKELKGPKTSAPLGAIDGFCRSNNIAQSDLTRTKINDIEFYIFRQSIPEKNSCDIFLNSLHEPISEYVWPKSMHWNDYKIKWVRPIKNILCIFDGQTIPFKYGHIIANNKSYGHRFMSPDQFSVSSFEDYRQKLKDNFVILDATERKAYIKNELEKHALKLNLRIKEDEALLNEVVGLVEYPQILLGKIDKKFLSVPSEILIDAMKIHQRYFSLFDENQNFAPYFLFASNIISTDVDVVISGNQKVLSARLSDALYFYNQDLKTSLNEKAKRLDKVIFHEKLGSVLDKTLRLAKIVEFIDPSDKNAYQAALLCKSDIVSEVVDEFPALQGIMGYYYAKIESLNDEIAIAIRDHYKPQGPNDNCPSGSAALVALADKIDTLCGLMLAGEKPSGSKDPFALRRAALGILRIILENKLKINLSDLVDFASNNYVKRIISKAEHSGKLLAFLEERIKHFFKDEYDIKIINAVLNLSKDSDLLEIENKFIAIKDFLGNDNGDNLLISYKRASNIIGNNKINGSINESAFISEHESSLFSAINSCEEKITSALLYNNYPEGLKALADMRTPLANFFDNVMVKDKDPIIANNRLLLLLRIKGIFEQIANFDKL